METADHRGRPSNDSVTHDWWVFGGLLATSSKTGCVALVAQLGKLPFLLSVLVPAAFALIAMFRLVERPMLHRPWHQRPEYLIRIGASLLLLATFAGLRVLDLDSGVYLVGPFLVGLAFFVASLSVHRVR